METKKKCRACLEEKELCEFYNLKSSKDGKDYKCIKCQKEGKKSFVEDIQGYKDCKACGLNKKLTDFSKAIENCDGRRGKCKKCVKDKVSIPTEILEVKEGFRICTSCKEEPKFVTVNIESATGEDLGKVSYIPLPNLEYVPKQETLEEAINKYPLINQRIGFKEGVKWQQERSYSEDEVKTIINDIVEKHCAYFKQETKDGVKLEWFEQFKKK